MLSNKPKTFDSSTKENQPVLGNLNTSKDSFKNVSENKSTLSSSGLSEDLKSSNKGSSRPPLKDRSNLASSQDWEELGQSGEIKEVSLQSQEKIEEYETHFPALGEEEVEAQKPETEFSTELLSSNYLSQSIPTKEAEDPTASLIQSQLASGLTIEENITIDPLNLKSENRDIIKKVIEGVIPTGGESESQPAPAKKWVDDAKALQTTEQPPLVKDEKDLEYETHFPTLGAEPETEPQTEFSTEILSPTHMAHSVTKTDPKDPLQFLTHKSPQLSESSTGHNTKAVANVDPLSLNLELKTENREIIKKVVEGTLGTDNNVSQSWSSKKSPQKQTPVIKDEQDTEYESHFPLLGSEPEAAKPEGEFDTKILTTEHMIHVMPEVNPADPLSLLVVHNYPLTEPDIKKESLPDKQTERLLETGLDLKSENRDFIKKVIEGDINLTETSLVKKSETVPGEDLETVVYQRLPQDERAEKVKSRPLILKKPREDEGALSKDKVPKDFDKKLVTEIEQEEIVIENVTEEDQEKFKGEEQRAKQDEQIKEIGEIRPPIPAARQEIEAVRMQEGYMPVKTAKSGDEEVQSLIRTEDKFQTQPRRMVQDELEPIEEKIEIQDETDTYVTPSGNVVIPPGSQNKGINLHDVVKDSLKELDKQESKGIDQDYKAKGWSSLDYLAEENTMNQSTELTLTAQRIDLIKEEIREAELRPIKQDILFQEVEKNLLIVKGLEKYRMYGAAINILKKSLNMLDGRLAHSLDFNIEEMNKLLFECNLQLSYCYNQLNEYRMAIDHGRAALDFYPKNIMAIYNLGSALLKAGDKLGGYSVLKQARRIPRVPDDEVYHELIDLELLNHETRAQEIIKELESQPVPLVSEIMSSKKGSPKKDTPSVMAGLGCFFGTALSSGLLSWFLCRSSLGLSSKKSWAYSIGVGTVVGGLSLALMGHNVRKSGK